MTGEQSSDRAGLSGLIRLGMRDTAGVAGLYLAALFLLVSALICGMGGLIVLLATFWGMLVAFLVATVGLALTAFGLIAVAKRRAAVSRKRTQDLARAEILGALSMLTQRAGMKGQTTGLSAAARGAIAGFLLVNLLWPRKSRPGQDN